MTAAPAGSVQILGMFPQNACLQAFLEPEFRTRNDDVNVAHCVAHCKGSSFLQPFKKNMVPDLGRLGCPVDIETGELKKQYFDTPVTAGPDRWT